MIRSSGSPRRRKGSGALKVEIGGLELSRRRKGQTFFPLHSLVSVNYKTQFKFCTRDYRRRQWNPTPVLLPGKSYGWRSLVGYSPWGRKESDMTERLHFHFSLSCIGEGNGNPLQCFCLENPRDGGAWWAAICVVAQSRTQLKQLSSSRVLEKTLENPLDSREITLVNPGGNQP